MSAPASPCLTHGCAKCCYETEMLVSEEDIARLEALGHKRDDFTVIDEDGFAQLKNVPGAKAPAPEGAGEASSPAATEGDEATQRCFFLKEDKCSVYAHRPDGCRWYPIIVNEQARVVRDADCPHAKEFPVPAAAGRKLLKIIAVMQREAERR